MNNLIELALAEDIGNGDITAELIPVEKIATAIVITREKGILCGQQWFDEVFAQLDPRVSIDWKMPEGSDINVDQVLCELQGPARALLTGERTALNFLQTLSGTATLVREYVDKIKHTKVKILDTRKTIPGLRHAQKYAVCVGGGHNHRMGLYDAFLIKENHIAACGSISAAVRRARALYADKMLEVEVENLQELQEALTVKVDRILCDNFSLNLLREAVLFAAGRAQLEASGNIKLENITEVAATGVDFISLGALTKDVRALDLSMRFF